MSDLSAYDSKGLKVRAVLLLVILFAFFFAWVSIKWQLADMLAMLTQPADPNAAAIAELSAKWAPGDPSAHYLSAASADDPSVSIQSYEQAVRVAPNDYRWRVELARAYAQDEQTVTAEREFKRAVELAPSYAQPHWYLGNFFLRRGRDAEAIAEFKKAAAKNHIYRDQVFSLAWDYFDKDPLQLEDLADGRPDALAHLAFFFAARGRAAESIRTWNKLGENEKPRYASTAKGIAAGLMDQRHFPQALEFAQQLGFAADTKPEAVTNPSFERNFGERDFGEAEDSRFDWQIWRTEPKMDIAVDNRVKHQGNQSLRVVFKNYSKSSIANISQNIVVQPNTKYRLTFWLMTENLKSLGLPLIEIFNPSDNKPIARSQPFPVGTTGWQQVTIDFITPENCDGITLRTNRNSCGEECQLTGTFWYDDFEIGRG